MEQYSRVIRLFWSECNIASTRRVRPPSSKQDSVCVAYIEAWNLTKKKKPPFDVNRDLLVGMTGFEPATSCSQSKRATNCATPRCIWYYSKEMRQCQGVWEFFQRIVGILVGGGALGAMCQWNVKKMIILCEFAPFC